MARVGRLAGAILAETGGDYYLVGHPKQPCDWCAAGFDPPSEPPTDRDAQTRPVQRLARSGAPALAAPVLVLEVEGDALPRLLADAFVIQRTGSVSERLWRLAIGSSVDPSTDDSGDGPPPPDAIAARWLGEMPPAIWNIVRDTVLRCT
jgi:hypothetical protein